MEEKILPIHELKYYHGDKVGFVFTGVVPSSDEALKRLVNNLVTWKVSEKLPEFFTRVKPNSVAFVYESDSGFKQAAFYQACNRLSTIGFFQIDTLTHWLQVN